MSGHLFRSQTSAFFHAVCGRMDSGTFSKSAGAVSGTAREAGAAPRLDVKRISLSFQMRKALPFPMLIKISLGGE